MSVFLTDPPKIHNHAWACFNRWGPRTCDHYDVYEVLALTLNSWHRSRGVRDLKK